MKEVSINDIIEVLNVHILDIEMQADQADIDLQQFGVDSNVFIRIVVDLEEKYEVEFPDDFLIFSLMNTANKILNILIQWLSV